jgi:hypothetical protein
MDASSGEDEFPYFKGGWVSKLPQEKNMLPSYVSQHCHSIVAILKNQPMYLCHLHLAHRPYMYYIIYGCVYIYIA